MKTYTKNDYDTGELNLLKMERKHLLRVLKMCRGKKTAAAHIIQVTPKTLRNMYFQHQIKQNEYIN